MLATSRTAQLGSTSPVGHPQARARTHVHTRTHARTHAVYTKNNPPRHSRDTKSAVDSNRCETKRLSKSSNSSKRTHGAVDPCGVITRRGEKARDASVRRNPPRHFRRCLWRMPRRVHAARQFRRRGLRRTESFTLHACYFVYHELLSAAL